MAKNRTIMVAGAGQMGRGIALICAQAEYSVLIHDLHSSQIEKSLGEIEKNLNDQLQGNIISEEEQSKIISRITPSPSLKDSVHCDLIIEAATENLTIKTEIFGRLSEHITPDTILATNTSSLSVTEISAATDCPENVIGLHFMNPVSKMMLVEVIRGLKTSDKTHQETLHFARSIGKEPIEVNDYPGFVSNRLLMPMINEAIICVFDGVADVRSVDRIMQLGMDHPMGPLALADLIGLDTCLSIMDALHKGLNDDKYRPCPLLRNMVKAGKLGCKSGEGFYSYD